MKTMKKYIKPSVKVIEVGCCNIIASSGNYGGECDHNCIYWHSCLDRKRGNFCPDKKNK